MADRHEDYLPCPCGDPDRLDVRHSVDGCPPIPVIPLSFYYGQDRLGHFIFCDLHAVQMGTEHCRCNP